ncbi:MAG TPA: serine hydrolase domain-containing protein [Rhizomicrobium sp.]|jgi:CubicO group peptidase (beta-lactamase class C family)|nr:serine hydrolase domain-containing protein [Rhizomicrobium sp.]
MNRRRVAATLLLALLGACSTVAAPGPPPAVTVAAAPPGVGAVAAIDPARIDAALKSFIDKNQLVGVSALVFKDDREVYFGAFGQADRENAVPMRRDTLVQVYSMTKPVTGVALLTLYERGLFKLDDPVAKYIPELAGVKVFAGLDGSGKPILETPHRAMTVLDLMRHTAGMTTGYSGVKYVEDEMTRLDPANYDHTLAEEARLLGQVPLVYHPGEHWLYSPAVDMQALMVERLSGEPFDRYLQDHIFGPLKMAETGRYVGPERRARLAALYDWHADGAMTRVEDERAYGVNTRHRALMQGSAGLVATIDDYMRFARMLENEGALDGVRILKRETVRLMSTNQLPAAITERSWLPSKGRVGFGLDVAVRTAQPEGDEAPGTVGEFFWDGAADTLFWVDPVNRIAAVLFTQYFPFGKVPLHKAFRDAVYGAPAPH